MKSYKFKFSPSISTAGEVESTNHRSPPLANDETKQSTNENASKETRHGGSVAQSSETQEVGQNTPEVQTSSSSVGRDGEKPPAGDDAVIETPCQMIETGVDNEKPRDVPSITADQADGSGDDAIGDADNVDQIKMEALPSTDDFFRFDDNQNFDEIVEALVEACKETKRKDQLRENKDSNEDFPLLNSSAVFPQARAQWPRLSAPRTFSVGMRDGRIELGFHVKDSERLFRLTGGTSSSQTSGGHQHNYIDAFDREELVNMLKANPQAYTQCTLRIETSRERRCYGQVPDPDTPDIYIPGRVPGAYDGDTVVVEMVESVTFDKDESASKKGYVKGVLRTPIKLTERQFVCTVSRENLVVMFPINKASPWLMNFTKTDEADIIPIYELGNEGHVSRAIVLRDKQVKKAKAGELLFVVKLLKWRTDCPSPLGIAVRHLPYGRDFATSMEILYAEYNIKRQFRPSTVTFCKQKWEKAEDWQVPLTEKSRPAYRQDVFTVDPPESRDLDDAISIRSLGNGNYELHIHIADVSYFVEPNTALDDEAKLRGTSYYPPKPHEPVPMLPRELSEGCCSLLEGKDRLAMTLSVEVSSEGLVVGEPRFERSIVRSSCRLSYSDAQGVINESRGVMDYCRNGGEEEKCAESMSKEQVDLKTASEISVGCTENDRLDVKDILCNCSSLECKQCAVEPFDSDDSSTTETAKNTNDAEVENQSKLDEKVPREEKEAVSRENVDSTKEPKVIPSGVKQSILLVHQVAVNRRRSRLGDRSFYDRNGDDDDDDDIEAHEMIAEIMIMANHLTAKYLLQKFPECTPLRVQFPPKSSRVQEWKMRFQKFARYSLGIKSLADVNTNDDVDLDIKVPRATWAKILATQQRSTADNFYELTKAVCDLNQFPQLALAYVHQRRIQQRASYTCSSETAQFVFGSNSQNTSRTDQENDANDPQENPESFMQENYVDVPRDECVDIPRETCVDVPRQNDEDYPRENDEIVARGELEDVARKNGENATQGSLEKLPQENPGKVWRGHASLELDAYCHFTSPIRRYIDVVVHRLVVACNASQEEVDKKPPYSSEALTAICDRCTYLARNSRSFDKDARKVQLALKLQTSVSFIQAWIDEITDDTVKLFFGATEFDILQGSDKSIRIARLGSIKNPEMNGEEMTLEWKFRLLRLDKNGFSQPKVVGEEEEGGDSGINKHTNQEEEDHVDLVVPGSKWRGLLEAVKNEDRDLVMKCVEDLNNGVQQDRPSEATITVIAQVEVEDSSPETPSPNNRNRGNAMERYQPPVTNRESGEEETDIFYRIKKSFRPCDAVQVQLASHITRGILSPNIQLFKITEKMHMCIEHRSFPMKCFAKASTTYASRSRYDDIDHYQKLWKPVLMMEIATSAVRENDVFTLSNLHVKLSRDGNKKLHLVFSLCKKYCINHDLDVFELNLLCVRIRDPSSREKDAGLWVGHFQIQEQIIPEKKIHEVETEKDEKFYVIKAQLVNSSSPIPQIFLENKFCYVTAEVICLSTPNRRVLGALWNVAGTSELIENICTGQVSKEDLEGCYPPQRNFSLAFTEHSSLGFKPLNNYQQRAVHHALTKPFTLIQGPPGTGKTVTGVHIAYWFAQMNKTRDLSKFKRRAKVDTDEANPEDDSDKPPLCVVFYCGPSNKSVDVVGRYLKNISGLKILRIYGQEIERKEFPIPDRLTAFRERSVSAQLKADEELRDVSLHHVIRKDDCAFAKEIKEMDSTFQAEFLKKGQDAPPEMISDYKKLISQAESWVMTRTGVDIILCTCTAAYSLRIKLGCHALCQCIVDECGMCIEAETLCAMMASNASQVVLIGDHKQLQPIIQENAAKNLGLIISMFERYAKDSLMLEIQYRMHEEICSFPSTHFYDGKLQTDQSVRQRAVMKIDLWSQHCPLVFYHLEGKEETQVVKTETGNENSKSNKKEIAKVVHVVRTLVNSAVPQEGIVVLSPYRAQCFEIGKKLKEHGLRNIAISSVVASQGSEKDYVILSLVRSLPVKEIETNPSSSWLKENLGFITDEHQINVALTRPRRGLCIIGNANLVGVCGVWKALLQHYEERGCLVSDDPTLVRDRR